MKKLLIIWMVLAAVFGGRTAAAADYSGWYEGTFNGTDVGQWVVSIDSAGHVEGKGQSRNMGPFAISGTVAVGQIKMTVGTASTGAIFDGRIDDGGQIRGTWKNTDAGGSFYGVRKSSYQ